MTQKKFATPVLYYIISIMYVYEYHYAEFIIQCCRYLGGYTWILLSNRERGTTNSCAVFNIIFNYYLKHGKYNFIIIKYYLSYWNSL